jgi:hypothetical protein
MCATKNLCSILGLVLSYILFGKRVEVWSATMNIFRLRKRASEQW